VLRRTELWEYAMKNIVQAGDAGRPSSGLTISLSLVVRNLLFTVVVRQRHSTAGRYNRH
jgi:hypothetical protein